MPFVSSGGVQMSVSPVESRSFSVPGTTVSPFLLPFPVADHSSDPGVTIDSIRKLMGSASGSASLAAAASMAYVIVNSRFSFAPVRVLTVVRVGL